MDNLGAHRHGRVRELVQGAGRELRYPPAYSPDLSPIEEASSMGEAHLRRAAARMRRALERAIVEGPAAVTAGDAAGYFAHFGYPPTGQPL